MAEPDTAVEVLLVEDNPTDAELCMRALRKHQLANKLLWVKDGAEALEVLLQTGAHANTRGDVRPKLMLLDLRLPKVDGLEVLRQLRANARTRTIPVVVLTSSKEDRDISEAYTLGANSFITKPVEFDAFAETIEKLGFYWLVVNKPPS